MSEGELFDAAFRRRAPKLGISSETSDDEQFLAELHIACSPLAAVMPQAVLELQARAQLAGHRQQYPDAMRRIVHHEGTRIARIAIDWDVRGISHGVDIAVLPAARRTLAGPHMLRAWLEVADTRGQACRLEVVADNPARHLYRRLGFTDLPGRDPADPIIVMERRG